MSSKEFAKGFIPVMLMVAGGTYFLSTFLEGKYEVMNESKGQNKIGYHETQALNEATDFDIHEELKRMEAKLDLDNWENVRAPRPGDEPQVMQHRKRSW